MMGGYNGRVRWAVDGRRQSCELSVHAPDPRAHLSQYTAENVDEGLREEKDVAFSIV